MRPGRVRSAWAGSTMKVVNITKKKRAALLKDDGTFHDNKTGVMGFVSREGNVKVEVTLDPKSLKDRVRNNVSKDATNWYTSWTSISINVTGL